MMRLFKMLKTKDQPPTACLHIKIIGPSVAELDYKKALEVFFENLRQIACIDPTSTTESKIQKRSRTAASLFSLSDGPAFTPLAIVVFFGFFSC